MVITGNKMLRIIAVIVVVVIVLFAGCTLFESSATIKEPYEAVPYVLDSDVNESEIHCEPEYEVIEFVTLPNGTRVDTRVEDEVVDLIFRHFEAIENGDVVAFRETLQGQDGASMNWHIGLILANFWDIVVASYEDEVFWGDSEIDLTCFGWRRVFFEEFPPIGRNTGMFIREIRYPDYGFWGSVMVALTNCEQEEKF